METVDSKIEICANSPESAFFAQQGGAYRVELCAGIPEGGTTPSYGAILLARRALSIKLHVIIRPRGGDFLYSEEEQEIMLQDIAMAKSLGVDGVVFGMLTPEGEIDMDVMRRFMQASEGLSVTFHRAFDMCVDPFKALEEIIDLGCDRILTSGQQPNALQGVGLLAQLNKQANGRIIIMPGCGVNAGNIFEIAQQTDCHEFHFSGRSTVESGMVYRNSVVSMGGPVQIEEYSRDVTDPEKVQAALNALRNS